MDWWRLSQDWWTGSGWPLPSLPQSPPLTPLERPQSLDDLHTMTWKENSSCRGTPQAFSHPPCKTKHLHTFQKRYKYHISKILINFKHPLLQLGDFYFQIYKNLIWTKRQNKSNNSTSAASSDTLFHLTLTFCLWPSWRRCRDTWQHWPPCPWERWPRTSLTPAPGPVGRTRWGQTWRR